MSDDQLRCIHTASWNDVGVSGLANTIPSLCEQLRHIKCDVELLLMRGVIPNHVKKSFPVSTFMDSCFSSFNYSARFRNYLKRRIVETDVVHMNSLWRYETTLPGRFRNRAILVCSPRGTLSPSALELGKLRKSILWNLIQRRVLNRCGFVHATSETEMSDIRANGITSPIALIPNGVHIPAVTAKKIGQRRKLTFVGRLHPIKNLMVLLSAWEKIYANFQDWDLQIVGDDVGSGVYGNELKTFATQRQLPRVEFVSPKFGLELNELMRNADLGILISKSENFGMTIAEFLAVGVPVIASKGTPWRRIENQKCGWYVDGQLDAVANCLNKAMSKSASELEILGANGRNYVSQEYSWAEVAEKMKATYLWCLKNTKKPEWIDG